MIYKNFAIILYCFSVGFFFQVDCSKAQLDAYDDASLKKSRLTTIIRQIIDEKKIRCKSCEDEFTVEGAVTCFYRDYSKEMQRDQCCFVCSQAIETLSQEIETFYEKFEFHSFCFEKFYEKLDSVECPACFLKKQYNADTSEKKSCCDSFSAHCKSCCTGTGACLAGCLSAFCTCLCSDVFCGIFIGCCECFGEVLSAFGDSSS